MALWMTANYKKLYKRLKLILTDCKLRKGQRACQ